MIEAQPTCPPLTGDVYDKMDDIIVTTYHSHLALGDGYFIAWGEDMAASGANATVMTRVEPVNGYNYTGTPLMIAVSGNTDAQAFLLTTTGLWSWGATGEVVGGTIVTTAAFSTMTMPPGVLPADVAEIKANSDVFFLVTSTGEVWVAGQVVTRVSGNALSTANTWHNVQTSPGVPLTDVVELTGSREAVYVRKNDNTIWTWGRGIALGGGAAATTIVYATQVDLSAIPFGVTLSQIGTYMDDAANTSGILALGSDGKVYGMGYDGAGELITNTGAFVSDWLVVQDNLGNDITDVVFLSTSDNSEELATAAIITTTASTNNLYTWGNCDFGNIGHPNGLVEFPTIPAGFNVGVSDPVYTSVGGHATSFIGRHSGGTICFVGHIRDGSGGNLQTDPLNFNCFNAADPNWEPDIELCVQQAVSLNASDDIDTTLMNTSLGIDVLENDLSGISIWDTSSLTIYINPINGIASVNPVTGIVTYTPDNGFFGIDTFSYVVCDTSAIAICDTAEVVVVVLYVNSFPTANADSEITDEDTPVTIDVLINDDFGGDGPSASSITVTTQGANGTATVDDNGTPTDPTDDQITYTPDANYNGIDNFIYEICDANGDCDTAIVNITINSVNDLPTANADSEITDEDTPVTIDVLINDDFGGDGPSASSITVTTQGANGTATVDDNGTPTDPTDDQITYTPNANYNGSDNFIYEICDANGDCDTAIVNVTINSVNDLPTANADSEITDEDTPVTIDVLINDDFGGDGPSASSITVTTQGANGTATVDDNGTPTDPTDDQITYTPNANYNGSDNYIYEICDANGDCDTAIVNVTINSVNDLPTANADSEITDEDTPVTIDVLINDDFGGDGPSASSITVTTQGANGTATVDDNGTPTDPTDDQITYTPNANYNGSDNFIYEICDANGDCDTAIVNVTINSVNDLPTANADSEITDEDTPVTIDVLINDDFGGDGPSASSITVTTQGANGTATVDDNGTPTDPTDDQITYTPNANYNGSDNFIYEICDANGDCDTAIVNVTINSVNDLPTANADSEITDEDTPVTIDVLINDDFGGDGPSNSSITVTTQGANGTATVDDNGTPTDPTDDQITYTPDANYNGSDNFIYEICDANGDCDTAIVNVTINSVNDLPTANADSEITDEDTPVTIDVLINDDFGGDGPSNSSITVTTQGANGTATVDDNGTPTDPTDDQITYTPDANYNGIDNFIYEICDANGDCDTAIVNVTINSVNDLPSANTDSEITDEDTPVTIDVLINDDFGGDGPSASSITVTTQGANGTATVDDNGTPTDPTDDQITYTPDANYNGIDNFIYEICDANGDCDTAIVNITINSVNDLPTANADSEITDEDTPVTIDVLINDDFGGDGPSASSITVTTQGANGTATVDDNGTPTDPTDDQITYTPNANYNGSDNFIYEICDANGDCDTAIVNVTINSVNDLPTANADSEITDEDTPVTIDVLINDDFGGDGPSASSITVTTQGANGTATVDDNGTPTDPTDDQITYTPNANYNGSDNYIYEICDANGDCDTAIVNVTINSVNDLPTANADSEITDEDTPVTIDVLINDDFGGDGPSNSSITVTTQGANGTATVDDNGTPTDPTDDQITYTPDANYNGSDNFIYEICDANGDCDTAIVNVTINSVNDLPSANTDSEITDEDTPVTIDVLINDDFGGDGPSASSITVTTQGANGTATVDDNGTPTDPTDDQITYTPDANYNGIDNFIYEICDANGDCDTAIVNVTINSVNDLPTANVDSEITDEDTPVTIDVLINDDFGGDGPSASSITVTTQGANGTATVDDNGTPTDPTDDQITYTPDANYNGSDNFIYEICDANGDCDTAIVELNITPVPDTLYVEIPEDSLVMVCTDSITNIQGGIIDVNVCENGDNGNAAISTLPCVTFTPYANFFGIDSICILSCGPSGLCDTTIVIITVTPVNDPPVAVDDSETTLEDTPVDIDVTVNDFDIDGVIDPTTVTEVTPPSNGSITIDPNTGVITYTPNTDFVGTDEFTYSVCDNGSPVLCDEAVVTITVIPTPDTTYITTPEEEPFTVCTDSLTNFGGEPITSVSVCGQPDNGVLTPEVGTTCFTYTPNDEYNGQDTVCIVTCAGTVCDTTIVIITVTPVNDPPVAVDDSETTPQDTPVDIDVTDNDFDIDGVIDSTTVSEVTPPSNGSITIDPNTGVITYTPNTDFVGTDEFTYSVCDNGSPVLCDEAVVTVTVIPTPDTTYITTPEEEPFTVCTDPLTNFGGEPITSVSVCGQPTNGVLTPEVGTTCFTYTPNDEYNGQDTVCIVTCAGTVCDTTIVIITITPVNDPPVAVDDAETTQEDTPVDIDVTVNDFDIDGVIDPTTVTEVSSPSNGSITIDPTTGVITYTPNTDFVGTDVFTYSVCDNGSPVLCDEAEVTVTVIPTPDTTYIPTPEEVPFTVCTDTLTNFGGEPITSVSVCGQPDNGVLTPEVGTTCFTYTPNDEYNGQDTACIVTCAGSVCDTTIIIITVTPVNDPPVAVDDSETTEEDTPVDIDVTVNDFDIDGVIDPTMVSEITPPSNGSITIDPNTGVITYTPDTDFVGTDEFTYSVCDNGSPVLCDEAEVTITIVPTPDTTYIVTPEEEPFTVCTDSLTNFGSEPITSINVCGAPSNGVLTPEVGTTCFTYTPNDEYNGQDTACIVTCAGSVCDTTIIIITVTPVNDPPVAVDDSETTEEDTPVDIDVTVNDFDIDGVIDPTTVSEVTPPSNGSITIDPTTGVITYTPNTDFVGTDVFTYSVCDNGMPVLCDTAVVTITVTPTPDTTFLTTDEDTPIDFCTLDNLNFGSSPIVSVSVCGEPSNGTISPAAGSTCFTYTPNPDWNGNDTLCIVTCAANGFCDTTIVIITVTPVNDPPVAVDDTETTQEDTPVDIDVTVNDFDIDGPLDPASVTVTNGPSNGTTTVDPETGIITYTPNQDFIGIDTFTYAVCDTGSPILCDTAIVVITVTPMSDTIFAVLDEDTEILLCTESVAQIEGPIVTIVACEDPVHGTISVEPSLCITYVPDANYNGLDSMCIISCNDLGQCDTTIIMIEVLPVNDPPVANDDFANTEINTPVTIDVIENDNDDIDGGQIDPTSVDVIVDPIFGSVVTNQDGTVTYTPVDDFIGIDSFAYVVCDLGIPLPSLCDTAYVFVNVSPLSGDDCFIPNSFSPNGDGNFDYLNIPCADYFPDLELLVYNRWGDQVYASGLGYQNDWGGIWDKKAVDLPDGTYYWIVKFNDGFSKDRAGYISLLR